MLVYNDNVVHCTGIHGHTEVLSGRLGQYITDTYTHTAQASVGCSDCTLQLLEHCIQPNDTIYENTHRVSVLSLAVLLGLTSLLHAA